MKGKLLCNYKELYLLQVQRHEGATYENLYYPIKKDLDLAIAQAKHSGMLNYCKEGAWETIPVNRLRVFEMTKRIRFKDKFNWIEE